MTTLGHHRPCLTSSDTALSGVLAGAFFHAPARQKVITRADRPAPQSQSSSTCVGVWGARLERAGHRCLQAANQVTDCGPRESCRRHRAVEVLAGNLRKDSVDKLVSAQKQGPPRNWLTERLTQSAGSHPLPCPLPQGLTLLHIFCYPHGTNRAATDQRREGLDSRCTGGCYGHDRARC